MISVDVQRDSDEPSPTDAALRAAVNAALNSVDHTLQGDCEFSLRIVDRAEMRSLNHRFRGQDKATNVLSFPAELPPGLPFRHLGDIAICAPVVRHEADAQGKDADAHWAHMVIHGTLHLLGYDHVEDADAVTMEGLETIALAQLGWPCPYAARPVADNTLELAR